MKEKKQNHKKSIGYFTVILLILGAILTLWWLLHARFLIKTEDAYVSGNRVIATPQISGSIKSVHVDDTQSVEAGDLLATFDKTDFILALQEAESELSLTTRDVAALFKQVERLKSEVTAQIALAEQAEMRYARRLALLPSGAVSEEEARDSKLQFDAKLASVDALYKQLEELLVQVEGTTPRTHPRVASAIEKMKRAYLDLARTEIRSPVRGVIAQREIQVGEFSSPESALMAIVPLDEIWVEANFKESKLRKLRVGHKVELSADLYGSKRKYHGVVSGIGAGTGSVFSVLPPQNASGNWIKIVQRVPVRIQLESEEVRNAPLLLGLSMAVSIDTRRLLSEQDMKNKKRKTLYSTMLFDGLDEGFLTLVCEILDRNLEQ